MNNNRIYTILIVDDEETTRITLSALLDRPNYRLEMAENGMQGFEIAKRINPDVILLDVMMPQMNGFDVCKRIRSDPQIGEVPIFLITALDDRDARLNGLRVGADDFLSKPIDRLELDTRLQTLHRVDRYRHLMDERQKLNEALIELSAKNRQLQTLSQQVLTAQENERRRVAVELHDEVGQLITGLKFILERRGEDADSLFAQARTITNELMQRVREMSLNLRPIVLDDFGLFAALSDFFKRFTSQTKIKVRHNINPMNDSRFDRQVETTVFRMVQEALTNIARHANVAEADVTLDVSPSLLHVSISDSGQGFDPKLVDENTSTGLSAMAERVNMAGGRFNIQSAPDNGTLISAEFDLKKK